MGMLHGNTSAPGSFEAAQTPEWRLLKQFADMPESPGGLFHGGGLWKLAQQRKAQGYFDQPAAGTVPPTPAAPAVPPENSQHAMHGHLAQLLGFHRAAF